MNGPDRIQWVPASPEQLAQARAAQDAAQTGVARGEWHPIATAPKDGTLLLLWDGESRVCGAWLDPPPRDWIPTWFLTITPLDMPGRLMAVSDRTDCEWEIEPTHWQPLPAPPSP